MDILKILIEALREPLTEKGYCVTDMTERKHGQDRLIAINNNHKLIEVQFRIQDTQFIAFLPRSTGFVELDKRIRFITYDLADPATDINNLIPKFLRFFESH